MSGERLPTAVQFLSERTDAIMETPAVLKQLNGAIEYLESHLSGEIDLNELARIACVSPDSFMRFFSYMTGMSPKDYTRRRKLTRAAYDLRTPNAKVIDIAVKYGYNSADAFSRAFFKQHGITPTQARDPSRPLKVFPPASFHIVMNGAKEMEFKIIQTDAIKLRGLSKQFSGKAADRFEQEHIMWADDHDNVQNKISTNIPGIWYGIWDAGTYSIARAAQDVTGKELDEITIPSGLYAVFNTGFGGFAGNELPKLREQIFGAWLADSDYVPAADYEVEIYHLFPKTEKHKRHYELWIPISKK